MKGKNKTNLKFKFVYIFYCVSALTLIGSLVLDLIFKGKMDINSLFPGDIIIALLPCVISIATLGLSIQSEKIVNISRREFNYLKRDLNWNINYLTFSIITIISFSFYSLYTYFDLRLSLAILLFWDVFYSTWFLIQEIPLLTKSQRFTTFILKEYYFKFKHNKYAKNDNFTNISEKYNLVKENNEKFTIAITYILLTYKFDLVYTSFIKKDKHATLSLIKFQNEYFRDLVNRYKDSYQEILKNEDFNKDFNSFFISAIDNLLLILNNQEQYIIEEDKEEILKIIKYNIIDLTLLAKELNLIDGYYLRIKEYLFNEFKKENTLKDKKFLYSLFLESIDKLGFYLIELILYPDDAILFYDFNDYSFILFVIILFGYLNYDTYNIDVKEFKDFYKYKGTKNKSTSIKELFETTSKDIKNKIINQLNKLLSLYDLFGENYFKHLMDKSHFVKQDNSYNFYFDKSFIIIEFMEIYIYLFDEDCVKFPCLIELLDDKLKNDKDIKTFEAMLTAFIDNNTFKFINLEFFNILFKVSEDKFDKFNNEFGKDLIKYAKK